MSVHVLGEPIRRVLRDTFLTALVGAAGSALGQWAVDAVRTRVDPDDDKPETQAPSPTPAPEKIEPQP